MIGDQVQKLFESLLQTNKTLKSLWLEDMYQVIDRFSTCFEKNSTLTDLKLVNLYPKHSATAETGQKEHVARLFAALHADPSLSSFECSDDSLEDPQHEWVDMTFHPTLPSS